MVVDALVRLGNAHEVEQLEVEAEALVVHRCGDLVRVFNALGEFLAGAVLSDGVRPGVAQIATGAWYDPLDARKPGSL
ncbi:molybdopterin dinucleotide binding domain-containing protein, partial [Variovorax sp. RHLX14]|uniref:molybdopterin dinucleotide binding domain-containing protein n=1 Tax=Variovorax sp. RHLX14 TaxID=1259731 RepID=UPI003F48E0B2